MSTVLIRSDNDHYSQYLKSLISQAGPLDALQIRSTGSLNKEARSFSGLLVLGTDSWNELSNIYKAGGWPELPVFIVTGNGNNIAPRPDWEIFPKPLNGTRFVDSVYRWVKQEGLCEDGKPPVEPYLLGNNPQIYELRKKIVKLSKTDISVLICGQTGTGKGVVAHAIHNNTHGNKKRFLALNCANVPSNLLESELFGYKKGAFTGAWKDKSGMFELAGDGTIFLDEISEMQPYMQAKLLQVLQEKEFCPVGGHENIQICARTIAATNADLNTALEEGSFRMDLYYRLAVVRFDLPLLKDRSEDIPVLGQYFLDKFLRLYNKKNFSEPSAGFWETLKAYNWPGNVRELESIIKTMVAMDNEDMIRKELQNKLNHKTLKGTNGYSSKSDIDQILKQNISLREATDTAAGRAEAELITRVLKQVGGEKKAAAAALSVSYKSLLKKIKIYGL